MSGQAVSAPAGLFGKAPCAGDFLRLNVSAALATELEAWIEAEMPALEAEPAWREDFDAAPPWRFALAPASEADLMVGVLGPGRDKVGRRYPCLVGAAPRGLELADAVACVGWLDAAESLLARLAGDEVEDLGAELAELGAPGPDDVDALVLRRRTTPAGVFIDVQGAGDGRTGALLTALDDAPPPPGGAVLWRGTPGGLRAMITPARPTGPAFTALFRPAPGAAAAPAEAEAA